AQITYLTSNESSIQNPTYIDVTPNLLKSLNTVKKEMDNYDLDSTVQYTKLNELIKSLRPSRGKNAEIYDEILELYTRIINYTADEDKKL
ncbi:MAG: hypothetical protein AABY14_01010, partial [Nanoarchaeota archaeon]